MLANNIGTPTDRYVPRRRVPDSDICIQATRYDSLAIKSNCVYLTEMALQSLKAAAFGNAPYSSKCIIATGYNNVTLDLKTSNTRLMPDKDVFAEASSDIPDP